MEKSKTLRAEETIKLEPYFTRADDLGEDAPQEETALALATQAIDCVNDYVIIEQDTVSSTIALAGDGNKLPTGTVVGVAPDSCVAFGDRVYFSERMVQQKIQHPAYSLDRHLVVIQAKFIYYRLP